MSTARFDAPSWAGLARVAVAAALLWAWLKLWPLAMVLVVSVVLAVTFDPGIQWLEKRGVRRSLGLLLLGALLAGSFAFFFWVVIPPLLEQGRRLLTHFQGSDDQLYRLAPPELRAPLKGRADQLLAAPTGGDHVLAAGSALFSGLAMGVYGCVLTLYFVAEGRRVYAWLVAYVPRVRRPQVQETVDQITKVIFAYVSGQLVTSAICAAYAFGVLELLRVPGALVLALLAGVFDVLPILGFVISVLPAMLMALTVSPLTVVWVLLAYLFYHALETYLIVPKVYGDRLRLSTLAVLISLAVGAELAGVVGAILVLPLVATYPIIERLWLTQHVGSEAVKDHRALDLDPPAGVVQEVIDGDVPGRP